MLSKIGIFLAVIFSINLIAADVFLYRVWNNQNLPAVKSVDSQECSINCPKVIDIPTPAQAIATITPVVKKTVAKKTRSIQYIPIPGSGSTLENKWVDLAGTEFYFSTSDYPNLTEAYFEANMRLVNGNGFAYLRLFDITAGIEVWGSEISTNSQNFTSVSSGKLTIRKGNHLYRVQAKSLTADTTVFNSGKIKIILENNF
jgi:hypothetical protein